MLNITKEDIYKCIRKTDKSIHRLIHSLLYTDVCLIDILNYNPIILTTLISNIRHNPSIVNHIHEMISKDIHFTTKHRHDLKIELMNSNINRIKILQIGMYLIDNDDMFIKYMFDIIEENRQYKCVGIQIVNRVFMQMSSGMVVSTDRNGMVVSTDNSGMVVSADSNGTVPVDSNEQIQVDSTRNNIQKNDNTDYHKTSTIYYTSTSGSTTHSCDTVQDNYNVEHIKVQDTQFITNDTSEDTCEDTSEVASIDSTRNNASIDSTMTHHTGTTTMTHHTSTTTIQLINKDTVQYNLLCHMISNNHYILYDTLMLIKDVYIHYIYNLREGIYKLIHDTHLYIFLYNNRIFHKDFCKVLATVNDKTTFLCSIRIKRKHITHILQYDITHRSLLYKLLCKSKNKVQVIQYIIQKDIQYKKIQLKMIKILLGRNMLSSPDECIVGSTDECIVGSTDECKDMGKCRCVYKGVHNSNKGVHNSNKGVDNSNKGEDNSNKGVDNKDIHNKDINNKDINNKDINNKDIHNKDIQTMLNGYKFKKRYIDMCRPLYTTRISHACVYTTNMHKCSEYKLIRIGEQLVKNMLISSYDEYKHECTVYLSHITSIPSLHPTVFKFVRYTGTLQYVYTVIRTHLYQVCSYIIEYLTDGILLDPYCIIESIHSITDDILTIIRLLIRHNQYICTDVIGLINKNSSDTRLVQVLKEFDSSVLVQHIHMCVCFINDSNKETLFEDVLGLQGGGSSGSRSGTHKDDMISTMNGNNVTSSSGTHKEDDTMNVVEEEVHTDITMSEDGVEKDTMKDSTISKDSSVKDSTVNNEDTTMKDSTISKDSTDKDSTDKDSTISKDNKKNTLKNNKKNTLKNNKKNTLQNNKDKDKILLFTLNCINTHPDIRMYLLHILKYNVLPVHINYYLSLAYKYDYIPYGILKHVNTNKAYSLCIKITLRNSNDMSWIQEYDTFLYPYDTRYYKVYIRNIQMYRAQPVYKPIVLYSYSALFGNIDSPFVLHKLTHVVSEEITRMKYETTYDIMYYIMKCIVQYNSMVLVHSIKSDIVMCIGINDKMNEYIKTVLLAYFSRV